MASLYEKDFYQWTKTQCLLLKKKEFSHLDIAHLIEEIESMGKSEKKELESYLSCLFCHLLKIKYQPEKHTRSWSLSIKNSRLQSNKVLRDNPSLKSSLKKITSDAYKSALIWAADDTGLDESIFPDECPWDILKLLKEEEKK